MNFFLFQYVNLCVYPMFCSVLFPLPFVCKTELFESEVFFDTRGRKVGPNTTHSTRR